jgi:hypothetical protein
MPGDPERGGLKSAEEVCVAPQSPQNLENHRRYVPLYHFVLFGIALLLLGLTIKRMVSHFSFDNVSEFLLVVALVLVGFFARSFAVTVQDRVIRLEVRLRLQALAPDLAARFDEFTPVQFTALRFAGDDELPALARQVLDGKLIKSVEIKKQIRNWKPDNLRA